MARLLDIRGLSTEVRMSRSTVHAVGDLDLHIDEGETLGLVGESGCGKSMTGLSIMRLLPQGGHITAGSIELAGRDLVRLSERQMREVRGTDVGMVFQDSANSLNPTKTIGFQLAEPLRRRAGLGRKAATDRAVELMALVGIPNPTARLGSYPHEMSGGQRQRVMIAIALSTEPKLLIADEPTTALDVTVQAQILGLLDDLKARLNMAILLITHDMGVVAGRADRVNVMYAGRIIETADAGELFTHMRHPYTQALLGSIPRLDSDRDAPLFAIPGLPPDLTVPPPGCRFAGRCTHVTDHCRASEPVIDDASGDISHGFACWHPVDGPLLQIASPTPTQSHRVAAESGESALLEAQTLRRDYPTGARGLRRGRATIKAVSGVSLRLRAGEILGLVGESGCGKSTLGRMIVGLEEPDAGAVRLRGDTVFRRHGGDLRRRRRDVQMMFQDPLASLDPRMRVGAVVREPLVIHRVGTPDEQKQRVAELLAEVGLPANATERFPHEMSGGQRQRVALARALALNPDVIVADEPVSALDVSIRSQVLNLIKKLRMTHDMSFLVISHDLAVVRYLADRIGVMYLGQLVEMADAQTLYQRPAHPYTRGLIDAIPEPDPDVERRKGTVAVAGELPDPVHPPSGCRFRTRCPRAQDICARDKPALRVFGPGHIAACHFPLVEAHDDAPLEDAVAFSQLTEQPREQRGAANATVAAKA